MSKVLIEKVNALVELEKAGIKFEPASESEVKFCCPVHQEQNPSCFLNTKKNLWKCQSASCGASGDIVSLLAFTFKATRDVIILELSKRYPILSKKTLNPEIVEQFHKEIWSSGPLIQELYKRGITDDLIRKARLGFNSGRITIPIYDRDGSILDIRRYLPGAPGPEKMKNTPGYGGNHLYQIDQAKHPIVWILGGEMKALLAGSLLNKHNVGALSPTAGEKNWDPQFSALLKDKIVYICNDVDKAGLIGAQSIAGYLYNYASSVYIIKLPLDKSKYPKGDINDYVASEKATDEDLVKLMQEATRWYPPNAEEEDKNSVFTPVILSEATNAVNVGKKIEINGVISTMDRDSYLVAKRVSITCDKSQPNCAWCPVKPKEPAESGKVEIEIKSTSPGILEMVNTPKYRQPEAIQSALGVPACKVVEFNVLSYYNVYDVRITPQLNIGNDTSKNVVQSAMCVGNSVEGNTPYVFKGKVFPHPKTQQAILLLDSLELGKDSLTSFKPKTEEIADLDIFKVNEESFKGVENKLISIYEDFEVNVTRIFSRQELHLGVDLCYHSPLFFNFDGEEVNGWVNILVLGDSSQGKSQTIKNLMNHYREGEKIEGKNCTLAGVLGGLAQMGTRWFVSWGVIPTQDRRLVVLEEIKGAKDDVISKLTDMRSSGLADLSKIEKRKAFARTRLIMTSNPKSDRSISAYNFGLEAVKELIPGLEDIRRLDLALIVASDQINIGDINKAQGDRPKIEHKYTSNLCQKLVLWSWTRTSSQVIFEKDSIKEVLEQANLLCSKFTDKIPLIDRGSTRHKLARLSAALAARLFSCSEDRLNLVVKPYHVVYVSKFIDQLYSEKCFGYLEFSKAQTMISKLSNPMEIRKFISSTKHPLDLVENLIYTEEIELNDICDWCETDRDGAQKILSFFVRKHALYRFKRCYMKTADFIELLKSLKVDLMKLRPAEVETVEKEEF